MPSKKPASDSEKQNHASKKPGDKPLPSLPPLMMFSDEPIERLMREEQLDADRFSETIARVCRGVEGPFNIGVFAGWGEGKTTALRQAKARLDQTARSQDNPDGHDIVTVWVNAWKYEHDQHPMLPLIACIVDEVEQKLKAMRHDEQGKIKGASADFFKKVSIGLRALAHSTTVELSGNVLPGLGAGVQLDTGKWAEEYEKLSRIHDPMLDQSIFFKADHILRELYQSYEEAKKKSKEPLGPKEDTKIVIFIDDLDRCLPDKAMALLESIKLVLAHPGFVFCMAIDRNPVDAFLQKRYADDFGMKEYAKASGGHYLDKLIQLPLHLPRRTHRFEKHIITLIEDYEKELKTKGIWEEDQTLSESLKALKEAAPAIAAGTDSNPRTLIRLLNRLLFDRILWVVRLETRLANLPLPKFLKVAAFSRILEDKLERETYLWLAKDEGPITDILQKHLPYFQDNEKNVPSDEIILSLKFMEHGHSSDPSVINIDLDKNDKTKAPEFKYKREGKLYELGKQLDDRPYLKDMLRTELGQYWLHDNEARLQVESYLELTRKQKEDIKESGISQFEQLFNWAKSNKTEKRLRGMAINSLAESYTEHPETLPLLLLLANDSHIEAVVRAAAIWSLARNYSNDEIVVKLLFQLAKSDHAEEEVRKEAIWALADLFKDHTDTLPLLISLVKSENISDLLRNRSIASLSENFAKHPDVVKLFNNLKQ